MTRGLCSTLKEKVGKVEGALDQGRADQDNNRDLDNLRLEQYRVKAKTYCNLNQLVFDGPRSMYHVNLLVYICPKYMSLSHRH